ncbi:hypothetical protein GH714_041719 [Hevea brasiliensis]|uniref:Endonuclease/exonuclease/phosphatase domain-containing protein n=1 Tax=Hevea brasiliensis TaxID=3981 RepID=A0A6A6MVH0_HEVBR|nr:hypothetical protein GH714_041719 [Hevea brasiliensis]
MSMASSSIDAILSSLHLSDAKEVVGEVQGTEGDVAVHKVLEKLNLNGNPIVKPVLEPLVTSMAGMVTESFPDHDNSATLALQPLQDLVDAESLGKQYCLSVLSSNTLEVTSGDSQGFYDWLEWSNKHRSWQLLRQLSSVSSLPWAIVGDFNEILTNDEKVGGNNRLDSFMQAFRATLDDSGLFNMDFLGYPYTWDNGLFARCHMCCCGLFELVWI